MQLFYGLFLAIIFFIALVNLLASVVLTFDGNPRAFLAFGIAVVLIVLILNILDNLKAQG